MEGELGRAPALCRADRLAAAVVRKRDGQANVRPEKRTQRTRERRLQRHALHEPALQQDRRRRV